MKARQSVKWFAQRMEERLAKKDNARGRYGWRRDCAPTWLLGRLTQEFWELSKAVHEYNPEEIAREAADVANFAMMIADIAHQSAKGKEGE